MITPVLLPIFLTIVLSRLSLASHSSRARIKKLEKDESATDRLVHILGRLERGMEDAVVDMLDDAGMGVGGAGEGDIERAEPAAHSPALATSSPGPNSSSPASASNSPGSPASSTPGAGEDLPEHPKQGLLLSGTQKQMAVWLNTLPNLRKELVWIHPMRNAHGTIIARDVKRFDFHKLGHGVVRHWTDHFVM